MKKSPAGMIECYFLKFIKIENFIFFAKFIPKGYNNCQLSIVNCQFDKFQSSATEEIKSIKRSV